MSVALSEVGIVGIAINGLERVGIVGAVFGSVFGNALFISVVVGATDVVFDVFVIVVDNFVGNFDAACSAIFDDLNRIADLIVDLLKL